MIAIFNEGLGPNEWKWKEFGFDELFDENICSCEVGVSKPSEEIFRIAIETCGVRPDEVVFVDDTPENVEGAKNFGMDSILFESADQLRKEFVRRGLI